MIPTFDPLLGAPGSVLSESVSHVWRPKFTKKQIHSIWNQFRPQSPKKPPEYGLFVILTV